MPLWFDAYDILCLYLLTVFHAEHILLTAEWQKCWKLTQLLPVISLPPYNKPLLDICCNPFLFIFCIPDCFTDQSSLPRTLCVYKRRDFSPPTRDSFFGESKHQTRTGNPGGQRNERSVSYLLVYVSIQMYQ